MANINDKYRKMTHKEHIETIPDTYIGDINIHFEIMDMEIAEDCQLVVFHILKQSIVESFKNKNKDFIVTSSRYDKRILEDLNA